MAGVQRAGRLILALLPLLALLVVVAPSAQADRPCIGCTNTPTVAPSGSGTFTGTLVVPGPGGTAQPIGGAPGGSSAGGTACPGCYSEIVPACGNGRSVCLGPDADRCLFSGGSPMYVLFFRPPSQSGDITGYLCLMPGQEPVPVEAITTEVRRYVDELVPRDPQVVVQPRGGALVRVPVLVRAQMSTAPISEQFFTGSGFGVTVTAEPVRWEWTFGEGPVQSYAFPGAAYDGSDPATSGRHVTRTYDTAGTRPVQVTVVWRASYELAGVGTVPVGEVRRPSAPVDVVVRTARSELVRG